ncbi:MAG: nucleotidyltransferase family protein [Rhodopila sp.]
MKSRWTGGRSSPVAGERRRRYAQRVVHAALFGSRVRGDAGPDSDTDIMIDMDPGTRMSVYDYVGLQEYIASLFGAGSMSSTAKALALCPAHRNRRRELCLLISGASAIDLCGAHCPAGPVPANHDLRGVCSESREWPRRAWPCGGTSDDRSEGPLVQA